jgi:hypothetical protein
MYVGLMVYCLAQAGLWDSGQIKSTIIWYFSVTALSLFRINHYEESPHRLKGLVADNFSLVGVIEYLVGTYTFHLIVEIVLVPVLFLLGTAVAVAEAKRELKRVHALLNGLLGLVAVFIIGATLYLMFVDIDRVASSDGLMDFIVPPVLTTLYTPFIALMMVYSTVTVNRAHLARRVALRHSAGGLPAINLAGAPRSATPGDS